MRKFKIVSFDAAKVKRNHFTEELTPEELKEAYAVAKASFTAADLQKYAEEEEGFFLDDLLDELKAKPNPNNKDNP